LISLFLFETNGYPLRLFTFGKELRAELQGPGASFLDRFCRFEQVVPNMKRFRKQSVD
jgi:hypothetical protein